MRKPTVQQIQKWVDDAASEWLKSDKATASQVAANVRDRLERARDEIISKQLGFDNHWGRWEVDHCNGRMSEVQRHIQAHAKEIVKAWFDENFRSPESLPKITRELRKAANEEYDAEFQRGVRELAAHKGREDAEAMMSMLFPNEENQEAGE